MPDLKFSIEINYIKILKALGLKEGNFGEYSIRSARVTKNNNVKQ